MSGTKMQTQVPKMVDVRNSICYTGINSG